MNWTVKEIADALVKQMFWQIMKYIIIPLAIIIGAIHLSFAIISDDFCNGWEDGYCEGYRAVKGQQSVCPVSPVCPVPEADADTYSRGFARGYEKGKEDAE